MHERGPFYAYSMDIFKPMDFRSQPRAQKTHKTYSVRRAPPKISDTALSIAHTHTHTPFCRDTNRNNDNPHLIAFPPNNTNKLYFIRLNENAPMIMCSLIVLRVVDAS